MLWSKFLIFYLSNVIRIEIAEDIHYVDNVYPSSLDAFVIGKVACKKNSILRSVSKLKSILQNWKNSRFFFEGKKEAHRKVKMLKFISLTLTQTDRFLILYFNLEKI